MPTVGPTATPASTGTVLERSDLFWDAVSPGEGPFEIESLSHGLAEADLVVVGHITAVNFATDPSLPEELAEFPVASASFAVDEVLKGNPQSEVDGTINLVFSAVADPQLVEQMTPSHQNVLFLYYAPVVLEEHGRPIEEQEAARYDYYLVHGTQAVIRDIAGTTRVLDPRNPDRFPGGFEGQPFETIVAEIRDAAAEGPGASASPASH